MKNKKGKTLKGVIRGNFRKYGVFVKTLYHGPEDGTRVGYFCRNIPVAVRLYGWCMAAVLWLVYCIERRIHQAVQGTFSLFSADI